MMIWARPLAPAPAARRDAPSRGRRRCRVQGRSPARPTGFRARPPHRAPTPSADSASPGAGSEKLTRCVGVEVVHIAVGDAHAHEIAGFQAAIENEAVDLGRIAGERARHPPRRPRRPAPSFRGRSWRPGSSAEMSSCTSIRRRDALRAPRPARHRAARWPRRLRPANRQSSRRGRAALLRGSQQFLELGLGFAGKAGDEGERMVISGQIARQARMRSSTFSALAGRFMALRMRGLACWKGTSR
jgi:hypothetical protein